MKRANYKKTHRKEEEDIIRIHWKIKTCSQFPRMLRRKRKWEEAGREKLLQCLIAAWAEIWAVANNLISVSVSAFVYCIIRAPSSNRRASDTLHSSKYSYMYRQII